MNTLLSAFLAFCNSPVYRYYIDHPNPFQIRTLKDQVFDAVIMWVLGSFVFLIPAMILTVRMLSPVRTSSYWTTLSAQTDVTALDE